MKIPKLLLLAGYVLALALTALRVPAQTFTFSTISSSSQGSDGSPFSNPTGLVVDSAGSIYVADQLNNAIRKITPEGTNWVISVIAGGSQGASDGSNSAAQFFGPTGLAMDSSGKLYVADQYNNLIRQVTFSGTNCVVTTIAGGAGISGNKNGAGGEARFSNPTGLAVDEAGNIFVADELNNAIRKITPGGATWMVTTIAGGSLGSSDGSNSAAQFFGPSGVAVDSLDRVYVADQFNNLIRLLEAGGTNWVVTTIAGQLDSGAADGSGVSASFSSPTGIAVDTNGNVFVADQFNNAIRKITLAQTNWVVSTMGGGSKGATDGTGTNAQFFLPYAVAPDAFGNVYVADSGNESIRLGLSSSNPAATGGVEVTLTPPSAITAGAQWQLDGGLFQSSGAALAGLAPGNHIVGFNNVTGFTTPANQTVIVTARQTTPAAGNFQDAIANAGSLQTLISPRGAVNAGAAWQVDSGAFQTNGAIVAGLLIGTHLVTFSAIAGWTTPLDQTVTITNAQTTLVAETYALQTGWLQIFIAPPSVGSAGAKWRVDGGPFQAGGATVFGLPTGIHTVSFNTVLGWSTPLDRQVTITTGESTTNTGTYFQGIAGTGALQVQLVPPGAVSAGAQWQVDGGPPETSETVVSNLSPGNHTVLFTGATGFIAPQSQVIAIVSNQTSVATGTYIQQGAQNGSLQVSIGPAAALNAGAEWQWNGGPLQTSGTTLANLAPENGTITFNIIPGWIPAVQQTVTILAGQATAISVTYAAGSDKAKPRLAITNAPPANARLSNASLVIKGNAFDNIAVDQVLFQLNNAGYQPAAGAASWSASLTLVPGPNTFAVKATDASGNVSRVASRTFFFITPSPLTVSANNGGSFAPALSGKVLDVGFPYLLTATPSPGKLFSSWSGAISSPNAALHFIMQSNMVLQANFIPNPFLPQQGSFSGLFSDTNGVAQQSSGLLQLTMMPSGVFSTKLQMAGGTYSGTGRFDLTGHAHFVVLRAHLIPLTLDLQLDFDNGLSGAISDGNWTAALTANRAVFNLVNNKAAKFFGGYTLAISGSSAGSNSPGGNGYATVSINSAGVVVMVGRLADGTTLNQTVALSGSGEWPFYVSLKGGGSALGWLTFSNQPSTTLGGALNWIRPAGPIPALYAFGFSNVTSVTGSRYSVSAGIPVLSLQNGQTVLSGVSLDPGLTNAISINNNNTLLLAGGNEGLTLALTKSTGLIIGSFHFPGTGAVTPIRGVILQEQNQAQGYFLGLDQCGSFRIESQ